MHVPCALHVWLPLQALPQLPQLSLAVRSCSQPLAMLTSQSPQSDWHFGVPHVPLSQNGSAWAAPGQTVPQAPQLFGSVLEATSQPFDHAPSQFKYPGLQVPAHVPLVQAAVAFAGVLHVFEHAPQLLISAETSFSHPSVRTTLQLRQRPVQLMPQILLLQVATPWGLAPMLHAAHEPQCWASLLVSASQPFESVASQFIHGTVQVMPHAPPVQVAVP